MNIRSGDGGVPGRDGELMQVRYNITHCIHPLHGSLLMLIHLHGTYFCAPGSQAGGELGTHVTAQSRVEHVEKVVLTFLAKAI